jgi:hypothetical protein
VDSTDVDVVYVFAADAPHPNVAQLRIRNEDQVAMKLTIMLCPIVLAIAVFTRNDIGSGLDIRHSNEGVDWKFRTTKDGPVPPAPSLEDIP